MRFFVLLSGFVGFFAVFIAAYTAERPFDLVVRDAALACVAAAFLGRWFCRILHRAVDEVAQQRRLEVVKAVQQGAAAATPPSPPRKVRPVTTPPPGSAPADLSARRPQPVGALS